MNLQPVLEGQSVRLEPLHLSDFEEIYQAASDPFIWEQHPDKNRWQRDVFKTNFFDGAILSKGAFKVIHLQTLEIIGSTRFYDWEEDKKQITIGYTFFERRFWGTQTNTEVKRLMLDYAFDFVESVLFVVGTENFRSQKAVLKLGAELVESMNEKLIFKLNKSNWQSK